MDFDFSQESYISLRNIIGERTNSIIAWVGSGFSADIGLPNWSGLKQRLQESLRSKIESLEEEDAKRLLPVANAITNQQDNWLAFKLLRDALGQATWQSSVREILRPAPTLPTPTAYSYLWKLKVNGVLSLNLDRLTTKAFVEGFPGIIPIEFNGKQAKSYTYVLKGPRPFICNLHGHVEDSSSWVLTKPELTKLLADRAYQYFIRSCLISKTVIFFGISLDDIAVGGHLKALTELGIDFGEHYWITGRRDFETDRFADSIGVRVIRYDATEDHHSALAEIFQDLFQFVPLDDNGSAQPVFHVNCELEEKELPSPEELIKMDSESIRMVLNQRATQILAKSSPDAITEYDDFSKTYDEAIYRAWYTSTRPGQNSLCNYQLDKEKAHGAFGTVYDATAPDKRHVAVKVLHEEIRRDPKLLHSFRRGVRSMSILSSHNIDGMVFYRDSSEIPTFVTMDWVDGPNLQEAVEAKQINDWAIILRISADIADIVRRGHMLPERVLHRDLRPSNIMLKEFYSSPDDWQVVVLDFDLSWHRGSLEKSVIFGSTLLGYLAPEQIQATQSVSTRHTAVDSFGLGMILYHMCSARHPVPQEHLHQNWKDTVTAATGRVPQCGWYSIPARFARLITTATRNHQKDRWDMPQIQGELRRMIDAFQTPESVESSELVAEELAARCEFLSEYIWDDDRLAAVVEKPSGITLELQSDESHRVIRILLQWGIPGVSGRGPLGKFIIPAMEATKRILKDAGWKIELSETRYASITVKATIAVSKVVQSMSQTVYTINRATDKLRFT